VTRSTTTPAEKRRAASSTRIGDMPGRGDFIFSSEKKEKEGKEEKKELGNKIGKEKRKKEGAKCHPDNQNERQRD